MKNIILILSLLGVHTLCQSQTLSQTTNRSSSILLGNLDKGNTVLSSQKKSGYSFPSQLSIDVATKDKKIEVENQYNFQIGKSKFFHFGMSASAKMNNSIASFFNNSNVVGGGEGSLLIGIKLFKIRNEKEVSDFFVANVDKMEKSELKERIGKIGKIHGHWFYINPSIEGRKFKSYFPDTTFNEQISKVKNTLWSINIGYNYWNPNIAGFNTILGASFTPKFTDNFADLAEFSIIEQQVSTNNTIQRASSSKTTAYKGEYKDSKKNNLNFEAFFTHNDFPSLGFYFGHLTTYEKDEDSQTDFSVGLYFSKPKQPTNPSVGVIFTFNDIYENKNLDDDKKFSINLVTRLNISKPFR